MGYNCICPICKKHCFVYERIEYVMQGPIKQYFHYNCLKSIARGNKHEEKTK